MKLDLNASSEPALADVQEWLGRAHVNAQTALLLVGQDDERLLAEAVSQVQQACEKATKAVMIAHGVPYDTVKSFGHNTIGAFLHLITQMMSSSPIAEDVSRAMLKPEGRDAAIKLARLVLWHSREKRKRDDIIYAWKQVLPLDSQDLGNTAIEVEQWERLTRAFTASVVGEFVKLHESFAELWRQYIDKIPHTYADPRPLLDEDVTPDDWVFGPDFAGLPKRFSGQESDSPTNPAMAALTQDLIHTLIVEIGLNERWRWPKRVNVRKMLTHMSEWLTSLTWLFLCATVITPHATSSRYPAESSSGDQKGSQHYNKKLGVVACIDPLAVHTESCIRKLMEYYRQIETGYSDMLR